MTFDEPFKLVVLISGCGSNLQALIDSIANGKLEAQIVMVLSNKSSAEGLLRARRYNGPTQVIDHLNFNDRKDYDETLAASIEGYSPDLVILAGFMRILGTNFIDRFIGKLIEIHHSILPKHPGLNTH